MFFTEIEKGNMLGALIVGLLFGALAAFASVGFDFEYRPYMYAESKFDLFAISAFHALISFLSVAGGIFLIFSYLPAMLPRMISPFCSLKKRTPLIRRYIP